MVEKCSDISLYRLYSIRRRTSSARGSSSSSALSSCGSSIRTLICISVAAITMKSPATSRSREAIRWRYSKKSVVICAMGMLVMSSSSRLMKKRSRSSGPSKSVSLTLYMGYPNLMAWCTSAIVFRARWRARSSPSARMASTSFGMRFVACPPLTQRGERVGDGDAAAALALHAAEDPGAAVAVDGRRFAPVELCW